MGKKGSKRKTRWRTLSVGAPPGDEDEEDGLRNGFVKGQDKEHPGGGHGYERNGQGGYTPRRSASGASSGGGSGGSKSRHLRDDSQRSPSQPKIIFNEDEYTRITTPRQDVLFKKGYLSRKKPWAGNASTSATPSTTESQSASHSTAGRDGSETTEDQQLLDRDSGGSGEYPPAMEPGAQLGYGTFYDHASGYYYEYPVMLVGPAPVPPQIGPGVLTAVPCGPVPLRPIEWINPAFVPKLGAQQYCMMDYQTGQNAESGATVEEVEGAQPPAENSNGACNEYGTGSGSRTGSAEGEDNAEEVDGVSQEAKESAKEEEATEEALPTAPTEEPSSWKQQPAEETQLENGTNPGAGPYLEPVLVPPPVHVSHVIPAVPQPYMYPGHYMFGPPLVNVNGVTIQSGPMIRTTDLAAMAAVCAKRRKKKKKRKQTRPAVDNAEDEEEGEYSSECDNGLPSSRVPWTGCPKPSTIATTTSIARPLNPECQEFQLRTLEANSSATIVPSSSEMTAAEEESSGANSSSGDAMSSDPPIAEVTCNGVAVEESTRENGLATDHAQASSLENSQSTTTTPPPSSGLNDDKAEGLTNRRVDEEAAAPSTEEETKDSGARTESDEAPLRTDLITSANDLPNANEKCERSMDESDDTAPITQSNHGKLLSNGKDYDSCGDETRRSLTVISPQVDDSPRERAPLKSSTPKSKSVESVNGSRRSLAKRESSNGKVTNTSPKRKYSSKGSKFVREATPGPDPECATDPDLNSKKDTCCKTELSNHVDVMNNTCSKPQYASQEETTKLEDQESDNYSSEICRNSEDKVLQDEAIEASTEDSGFESQPRRREYPITEAVKAWLRKANSPDLFITCRVSTTDSETDEEGEVNEKPPKNLHGNPMPALSANGSTDDDASLSGAAENGEFARSSNGTEGEHAEASCASRKKRELKGAKRKSGERANRRGARSSVERTRDQVVSSSDSCCHQENSHNAIRATNPPRQDVGDVCEFSEKDSVAGMRVAVNSRVDSKRANARRAKRSGKSNQEPVENVGLKMRRVDDRTLQNEEGIVDATVNVRTFEKGEIIVTEQGKLLTPTNYQPFVSNGVTNLTSESECSVERNVRLGNKTHNNINSNSNSNSEEETANAMIHSVGSIEEPDVLECWEAETIEPVITPRKMLQSRGIYCEGEAAEDESLEVEHANIERVQKYYRLARESATSLEEEEAEPTEEKTSICSPTPRTLPKKSDRMMESFCGEEIPVELPTGQHRNGIRPADKRAPIEEAFEVYESCYTGSKPDFQRIDPNLFRVKKPLLGGPGERPIPCKAVCCILQ